MALEGLFLTKLLNTRIIGDMEALAHSSSVSHYLPLKGIIGLRRLKQQIMRCVVSCRHRSASFPHTLLTGLGGTGKTTIARNIAEMLGIPFFDTEAAELRTRDSVNNWISSNNAKAQGRPFVMFVDEIHRLSDRQEAFYYPMVDGFVNHNNKKIILNQFTLIGATTRRDMLDQGSFITRFQNVWDIGRYGLADMEKIVRLACENEDLICEAKERSLIARRCLGIPRTAVNLVEKIRDQVLFAHHYDKRVHASDVSVIFNLEEIDCIGLQKAHIRYLLALAQTRSQPKGLGVLSAILGRNKAVVEDTVEPILISLGMISATPKGRILTSKGHDHLVKQGLI